MHSFAARTCQFAVRVGSTARLASAACPSADAHAVLGQSTCRQILAKTTAHGKPGVAAQVGAWAA